MWLEGTNIRADEFCPAGAPSLITHFHRDHLRGVERATARSRVYCSEITARLLTQFAGVPASAISAVAPGMEFDLPGARPAARALVLHANHCPGAVMFHVEARGKRMLYTGDFRLDDRTRAECAALAGVDLLYLDRTYDDPRYSFPQQSAAIEEVLGLIRARPEAKEVLLAIYTVGKNRVLRAVSEEFGLPVYATAETRRVYAAIGMGDLVTDDKGITPFRAYSRGYFEGYFKRSPRYRNEAVAVIIPTGWAGSSWCDPRYHYVAYSEHCDHAELEEFRRLARPKRIKAIR